MTSDIQTYRHVPWWTSLVCITMQTRFREHRSVLERFDGRQADFPKPVSISHHTTYRTGESRKEVRNARLLRLTIMSRATRAVFA